MRSVLIVATVVLSLLLGGRTASAGEPNWQWFAPGSSGPSSMALNSSGTILAACDGGSIKIWNLQTGNFLRTLDISCIAIALHPTADIIAVGDYQKITFINSITGEEISSITGLQYGVHSVAYSSNGLYLAAGGGYTNWSSYSSHGELKVYRTSDNALVIDKTSISEVHSVAVTFDPADNLNLVIAAAGHNGIIRLYNLIGGSPRQEIYIEVEPSVVIDEIYSIAFSDDAGYLVAGGGSNFYSSGPYGRVALFKRNVGGQYDPDHEMTGHTDAVKAVGFYAGFVISGGKDKTVRFFRISDGGASYVFTAHEGYPTDETSLPAGVEALAVNPSGPLVTGGAAGDGTIWLWNLGTPSPQRQLNFHRSAVQQLLFRNYLGVEDLYSVGADRSVRKWQIGAGDDQLTATFTIAGDAYFADLSRTSEQILTRKYSAADNLQIWTMDGVLFRNLTGCGDGIDQAAFSPNGQWVAGACRGGKIYFWRVFGESNGLPRFSAEAGNERIRSLSFSPDGLKLLTADNADAIKLWRASDGKPIRSYTAFEGGDDETLWGLGFDPSGSRLAVNGEDGETGANTIQIWSTGKLAPVQSLSNWSLSVPAFTPDGGSIYTSSGSGIQFYRISSGESGSYIPSTGGYLNSMALSPDGLVMAAACDNNTLRLVRVSDSVELENFDREVGYVQVLAYSETGSYLALARQDGSIGIMLNPVPTEHSYVAVASYNPDEGVLIRGPRDTAGAGNGRTPFGRSYSDIDGKIFTAPLEVNGKYFQYWLRNGRQQLTISPGISVHPGVNQLLTAVYSASGRGIPPLETPTPVPGVEPPVIRGLINSGAPLRVTVNGRNFKPRVKVFVNHQRWRNFRRLSARQLVLEGGTNLSAAFNRRKPSIIRLQNPDGGQAFKVWR